MGYTHYWTIQQPSQIEWDNALEQCRLIVEYCISTHNLCGWNGDADTKPEVENGLVFNGCEEEGHETFTLDPEPEHGQSDFCKTARKPYDEVVVTCLAILDDMGVITVGSDGTTEEWEDGVHLASKLLGRTIPNPLA